jgi:Fur family ferric uptake transcriptional regulator
MTVPHAAPGLAAPTAHAALGIVRARGMRVSSARRQVIETLYGAGRPLKAEELARGVGGRPPAGDIASVYRNLDALEAVGLIRHLHVGHGAARYVLAADRRPLVACERCGALRSIDRRVAVAVRRAVFVATGYDAWFEHFPITGLCPLCAVSDQRDSISEEGGRGCSASTTGSRALVPARPS